jgi:hypothetical protein
MTVTLHTDAEVARAWRVLDELYAELPHNPLVAGARAAAEWTTGRTATPPITDTTEPPVGSALVWEAAAAEMIALGQEPGDRKFADGVTAWMYWFVGLERLPRWLR